MDPVTLIEDFMGLLDAARAGQRPDTEPLRRRIVAFRSQTETLIAAVPDDRVAFEGLNDFHRRLTVALDVLDAGDPDGAVTAFRRALYLSMRGVEPPDLAVN